MSNLAMFPDLSVAREQAAEWIARQDRGLTATEQTEFRNWCASPANARALQEMSALWNDLGVIKVLAEVFPSQTAPPAPLPIPLPIALHADPSWGPRARWVTAAAAAVLALVATSAFLVARYGQTLLAGAQGQMAQSTDFETAVGEQRSVALADGSVLALNTDSRVEVQMRARTRELRLLRGEVHFTVAHDASRPFRVNAGGRIVQAVGTAFDVRLHRGQAIEVIVTEGQIKVMADGATPIADRLDRGQSLWIDANGSARVQHLDSETLASRLAWRNGMLVFDGQTLQSALEEFSRYTPDRLVIADASLRNLRIGGYFPAGDTEALLEALRTGFGLEISRTPDGVMQIRRGRTQSARPAPN
jgi:transmembrane sensor